MRRTFKCAGTASDAADEGGDPFSNTLIDAGLHLVYSSLTMACPPADKTEDSTKILHGDQLTLKKEFERAKEQPACLIMIRGNLQGHRYFLTEKTMTIGRDPAVEISITDPSISRRHADVVKVGEKVQLVDLGSANGTVVNGKKVGKGEKLFLAKEDMIRLGNTILKFLPAGEYETLAYGHLESAAHTDALTRCFNKRYLNEALNVEFKRAKALATDFSVLYIDLDHFKSVNDSYTHDAGDYVLKDFSKIIQTRFVRPRDVFARFGGEEFVVLLANTGVEDAQKIAENIRSAIESHLFIYEGRRVKVTASLGVAELDSSMDNPNALLKMADKALYQSKQEGRNRVTVARP